MVIRRFRFIPTWCRSILFLFLLSTAAVAQEAPQIRHSVLIAGGFTGIIDEQGKEVWKTKGGAKDAMQMANGHVLITYKDEVVEFDDEKEIVWRYSKEKTDTEHFGGKEAKNWPFTAIRLENGNTLVGCTYGNRVVEFDTSGKIVWELTNDDVGGIIKDACGVQRLPNGNTVVTSYGHREKDAVKLLEVTPDKKVVWTYNGHFAHHFQVLTTNGRPIPGNPMK